MTKEQIKQSVELFNALPSGQKQEVWDSAVEQLSKLDASIIDGGDWITRAEKWVNDRIGPMVDFNGNGERETTYPR